MIMYIAILGRQPALGTAELESIFGGNSVKPINKESVLIDCDGIDIQHFGGLLKTGKVILKMPTCDWRHVSSKVTNQLISHWSNFSGKLTLGISAYNFSISPKEVQKVGIIIKQQLKRQNISVRLIPNNSLALTTATSHHNKLGLSDNKVELLIVRSDDNNAIVALSTGAQNITAYANRDQARPKRDAFVGMLPPKLAQIMINLAVGGLDPALIIPAILSEPIPKSKIQNLKSAVILDPFCGTGVILQEAALLGYAVYGTDLSEKMVKYTRDNLNWLADTHHIQPDWYLHVGDAMTTKWRQPIDAVVCESYLGQPFSAPPSPAKLAEVVENCNHIITEFLKNLSGQINADTPVCIAVPAWRGKDGRFTHLPLISQIARLGYKPHEFVNVSQNNMLYFREDQVVARELLVIVKQ